MITSFSHLTTRMITWRVISSKTRIQTTKLLAKKRGKGAKYVLVERFEKATDVVAWTKKEWKKGLTWKIHGKLGTKVPDCHDASVSES